MRKLYTLLAMMLVVSTMLAQVPQTMSYQAVVRDADNNLITNQIVGMRVTILQGANDGTAVYTQTLTPTTNANVLVTVEIGGAAGFDAIEWANGPYFIKTETDTEGGTDYTITGTSQLLTVPYALHAKTAESTEETDPLFTAWDKSTGIEITEEQITDLQNYVLEEADPVFTANFDFVNATTGDDVTDEDGNEYATVWIGTQEWMAENLKTTKYSDGTSIPTGHSNADWAVLTTGAYAIYPHANIDGLNSDAEVLEAYGALYNWYAVNTGNLCPTGWRVPTDAEWTTLTDYAGGMGAAMGKLKSTRTAPDAQPRWDRNIRATDEYGFSALPGGNRYTTNGYFFYVGLDGYWWSSTESAATYAWSRYVPGDYGPVTRADPNKGNGFSVRCVRDN